MRQYTNPNSNPKQATPPDGNGNREPFPSPPTVLEDHPFIRILQHQGFQESDFDPTKRVPVPLTQAEIRTLVQHHLDAVYQFLGFMKTGGSSGSSDFHRDAYHRERFGALTDLLSEEDREKFLEITRIRNAYIETLHDPKEGQ
jgi:hypothetical protein